MKIYAYFILFLVLGCASTSLMRPTLYRQSIGFTPGQTCQLNPLSSELRTEVRRYFEESALAGLALHIQLGKKDCTFETYLGVRNVSSGGEIGSSHKFRIGSITKSITASKVLELIDKGKLSLEDPISNFLPGSPKSYTNITIRHLLTHMSGIDGDFGYGNRTLKHPRSNEDILLFIFSKELNFSPGSQWSYSNSGYYLLGFIIENITSENYFSSLRTLSIFKDFEDPLSSVKFKEYNYLLLADPHIIDKSGNAIVAKDPYIFQDEVSAVGSVVLTAKQMTYFFREFFYCGFFSCNLLEKALRFTTFDTENKKNNRLGYGFGVAHYRFQDIAFYGHEGYTREDTSISVYSPLYDLSITALTNTDKKDLYTIVDKILNILKNKRNI